MYLTNIELNEVNGGSTLTATLLNAVARLASSIYEIGYNVGSSLRRLISKSVCK
jgi:hypothetical protein